MGKLAPVPSAVKKIAAGGESLKNQAHNFLSEKATKTSDGKASRMKDRPPRYDISIILNLHDEARYIKRTLLSLEDAVRYARQFDITFEIVVVLDKPDLHTQVLVEGHDYCAFDGYKIICVDNGSLGPSRNDGIRLAEGEYIATADADDLVGFDYFQRLYMTAFSSQGRAIVFPEYYVGFGIQNYVWKFWRHPHIGSGSFFERHPYISRLLFRRDVFDVVQFADASLDSGFAYEDWHFNCECLAAGYSIEIAKDAVVFYRQRPGSLLRLSDAQTSKLIRKSRFFEPNIYLKLTWAEMSNKRELSIPDDPFVLSDFLSRPGVCDIVAAANKIDPSISIGIIEYSHCSSNYNQSGASAAAYFQLCRSVAGQTYTDVVLFPFIAKGGAEKYILSVLESLTQIQSDRRFLFLFGQKFDNHEWLDRLPKNSQYIDLHDLVDEDLSISQISLITFRMIQNLRDVERVHIKGSEYGDYFIREYSSLIEVNLYYYYFCDAISFRQGHKFVNGHCFDLLSEWGANLTGVISDHSRALKYCEERIGAEFTKNFHTLYAKCELGPSASTVTRNPTFRLFWASRLDKQKRPELVSRIAKKLTLELPNVHIDAYGDPVFYEIGPEVFCSSPNLTYKGGFNGLESIVVNDYDALIYTTNFDGLPNIVLETLALGLPVIAPDIGGLAEAVTGDTGYLVEDYIDEDSLADAYVEAICMMYADWSAAVRRGQNGRNLVAERHSEEAHILTVSEIFTQKSPTDSDEGVANGP